MGRVANGKDVGVTDGCECIVSDNLAAFSHRDAGIGGERRYQEARRPETFIKGNGSAIFHFGVTGVNGGDARAGDDIYVQTAQCRDYMIETGL